MKNYELLKTFLANMNSVVIGYSGGVDSTLLATAANEALGKKAISVLVESCLMPEDEIDDAVAIAEQIGLNLLRIKVNILSVDNVVKNPPKRCYYCKLAIFSELKRIAKEKGASFVVDGANVSDEGDYRPGSQAICELGVRSPFKELGWSKELIRSVSQEIGLPTWNKPSFACLASRIPYNTPLSREVLKKVENAELELKRLGFTQFRVRHHGEIARIEVCAIDMEKLLQPAIRHHIIDSFRNLGYVYVTLDLDGYRSGSMNEVLDT